MVEVPAIVVAMKGHFDGKVIVPDEPVSLPVNQPLIVRVEPVYGAAVPHGVVGGSLLRFAGSVERPDVEQMSAAIERDCGRIDRDEW